MVGLVGEGEQQAAPLHAGRAHKDQSPAAGAAAPGQHIPDEVPQLSCCSGMSQHLLHICGIQSSAWGEDKQYMGIYTWRGTRAGCGLGRAGQGCEGRMVVLQAASALAVLAACAELCLAQACTAEPPDQPRLSCYGTS